VTLPEATFREARKFLRRWGEVHRSGYFHILTLTVDHVESFLAEVAKAIEDKPGAFNILSHIISAQRTFTFASAEEFEAKARGIAILWAPMLAGKSFYVRFHRREFKGALSTPKEERFLDETLLGALETLGALGRISFTDPDAILQIVTIDNRAGVSLMAARGSPPLSFSRRVVRLREIFCFCCGIPGVRSRRICRRIARSARRSVPEPCWRCSVSICASRSRRPGRVGSR
jgi:tRNA(Ser,Leu) C12 N-acetylase TAN1